jgi:ABC-type antimicrobial peptide transport system permease subunit
VYGVLSYVVAQRTQELGVRVALGAPRGRIMTLVLWRALGPLGLGLVAGLAVGVGVSGLIAQEFYGVTRYDPWILASVAGVLAAV